MTRRGHITPRRLILSSPRSILYSNAASYVRGVGFANP
nr:MAG TPA: hypothetical protein [Caudoviricetes sp.]